MKKSTKAKGKSPPRQDKAASSTKVASTKAPNEPRGSNTEPLQMIVAKFRAIEKRSVADLIEQGRLVQAAFDKFEHSNHDDYNVWLVEVLGVSLRQSDRYRSVYKFNKICHSGKFGEKRDLSRLKISVTALYDLSSPHTSSHEEAAISEALEIATTAFVTPAKVSEIFKRHNDMWLATRDVPKAGDANIIDEATETDDGTGNDKRKPDDSGTESDPDLIDGDDADLVEAETDDAVEIAYQTETDSPADANRPEPNALSEALRVIIANHDENAEAWSDTTQLFKKSDLLEIGETLYAVQEKYYGGGEVQAKADRAEAKSRKKLN
jgi:hypothetical protein